MKARGATNVFDALETAITAIYKHRNEQGDHNGTDLIFFLTDGRPTLGKFIKSEGILKQIKQLNYRGDAVIHTLGFGDDVNEDFLERLAMANMGRYRKIHLAPDASLQFKAFYREVSTPLLNHLDIQYSSLPIDENSLTRTELNLLYDGSEILVAGKIQDSIKHYSVNDTVGTISGESTSSFVSFPIYFPEPTNSVTITSFSKNQNFIERLWAHLLVQQLLRREKGSANEWLQHKLKAEVLELSLKYQFVTPLTAMIVTVPNGGVQIMADGSKQEDELSETDKNLDEESNSFEYEWPEDQNEHGQVRVVGSRISEKRGLNPVGNQQSSALKGNVLDRATSDWNLSKNDAPGRHSWFHALVILCATVLAAC